MLKLAPIKIDFIKITLFSELLPLIFVLIFFKKINTKALKVFFVYAIALTAFVVVYSLTKNSIKTAGVNGLLIKSFTIIEFLLISLYLYNVLLSTAVKKTVLLLIPVFSLTTIIIQFFVFSKGYSSIPLVIESFLFIMFFIIFFYEKMKTVNNYPLSQSLIFWISVGFFIYFTGNFFVILFISYSKSQDFVVGQRIVYMLVTVSKNAILSLAFFANEPSVKQQEALEVPDGVDLGDFTPASFKN